MFKRTKLHITPAIPALLMAAILGAATFAVNQPVHAQSDQDRSEIIENATFKAMDGNTVSVSDFEGKVVLVDFWETWCGPCLESFPTMQKLVEEYPDKFAVLAVTPGFNDTKEDAEKFIKKNDYDFTFVMDENSEVSKKLGIRAIPFKIVLDSEGEFVKTIVGSKGSEKDYKSTKNLINKHYQAR